MNIRTTVVVAAALGFFLADQLSAEEQERPSMADAPASARRTPQGLTNDNCEDAIPIFVGETRFDTTGAATDGSPHPQCEFDGQTYHDIWFKYVPSCSLDVLVSTCNNADYDTDLVVYDGCYPDIPCPPGNEHVLGCNDDAPSCAGFTSEVVVPVIDGNCYTVRVGGWNDGDQGSGVLGVEAHCDPCEGGNGICEEGENTCNCPADCPGECLCLLFTDQAEFEAFSEGQGRLLKGIEDFEECILPPAAIDAFDDSLCGGIPNSPDGFPFPNGLDQLNLCVQANLNHSPDAPNPRGKSGLRAFTAGYLGAISDAVSSGVFLDSFDMIFTGSAHTGIGFNTLVLLGGATAEIRVYDEHQNLLINDRVSADQAGSNFFGVSCLARIGRINIFDPSGGIEGGDNIQMWVSEVDCGSCPTDIDGDGHTGPFDLAFLLGFWGPCAVGEACICLDADDDGLLGPADLAVLLGAWGPCE